MDGWNRIDAFNILGESVHHHAAGGDARRARAVHPDRRAVHRRVPPRRSEPRLRLRRRADADLDHLVHRPRRAGRPRRHRAHRQHHRRLVSACRRASTRSTRRSTTPPRPKAFTQELRLSGERGPLQWVAGVFYSDIDRDYAQNLPVFGFEDRLQGRRCGPLSNFRPPERSWPTRTSCTSPTCTTTTSSSRSSARRPGRSPTASTSPAACATTTSRKTARRSSTASSPIRTTASARSAPTASRRA